MTKKQSILNYLLSGKTLTAKQGQKLFRTNDVSRQICSLRNEGYPNIYTNRVRDSKGKYVFQYRLGTPTKTMRAEAKRTGLQLTF